MPRIKEKTWCEEVLTSDEIYERLSFVANKFATPWIADDLYKIIIKEIIFSGRNTFLAKIVSQNGGEPLIGIEIFSPDKKPWERTKFVGIKKSIRSTYSEVFLASQEWKRSVNGSLTMGKNKRLAARPRKVGKKKHPMCDANWKNMDDRTFNPEAYEQTKELASFKRIRDKVLKEMAMKDLIDDLGADQSAFRSNTIGAAIFAKEKEKLQQQKKGD